MTYKKNEKRLVSWYAYLSKYICTHIHTNTGTHKKICIWWVLSSNRFFLWLVCNVDDWVGTVATWRWGRWGPEGCRCWRIANASHCGRGWASPGRWSGRVPLAARIGGSWRGLRNPRRKPSGVRWSLSHLQLLVVQHLAPLKPALRTQYIWEEYWAFD